MAIPDFRMLRERSDARYSYSVSRGEIVRRVLIPKYYDPVLETDLRVVEERTNVEWTTLSELISEGLLAVTTGVEVGKMAYGTGDIPFIRTSDISDLEIRRDTKHGVSPAVYANYAEKASLQTGDILVVRDGTYLVGSSAVVGADETPALICGGLYRLRCQGRRLDPFPLLPLLNLPIVRRQMRARQFTRDVIDTLGKRLLEVRIPHPASTYALEKAQQFRAIMAQKAATKKSIDAAIAALEPSVPQVVRNRPGWSMCA